MINLTAAKLRQLHPETIRAVVLVTRSEIAFHLRAAQALAWEFGLTGQRHAASIAAAVNRHTPPRSSLAVRHDDG